MDAWAIRSKLCGHGSPIESVWQRDKCERVERAYPRGRQSSNQLRRRG